LGISNALRQAGIKLPFQSANARLYFTDAQPPSTASVVAPTPG
jgi:hypothetical protein